jgi:hypothetical protein
MVILRQLLDRNNEKTTLFAEYNSTGEGSNAKNRVKWRKGLSKKRLR